MRNAIEKALVVKHIDYPYYTVVTFKDAYSRATIQDDCDSLRAAIAYIDRWYGNAVPVDVRHVLKKDSSWHTIR